MDRSEYLKASPPMFKSGLLDRFTRVHHLVPVVIFLPAIVILFALGVDRLGLLSALAFAVGGYFFWTLAEYWIHRVIFHFEPEKGIGARLHWIIHGVHHDHPNDPLRLVMPPGASIPLALVFYALFVLVLGSERAFAFGAGFLAGYLFYDVRGLDDPALKGAELYLKMIRTLDGNRELFAFSIPFDKWLAASGTANTKISD